MNTNFFNQIQQLDFTGVLQLNISKGIESNLIVTVLLNNEQCGDSAKNLIPPLTFNATPQEFDEGFFEQITTPIQKVSGLMVDMEKFLKQLEEVKKHSAIEKEKADRQKKEQEAKDKKFKDAMAKADELEKEGKFREAWMESTRYNGVPRKSGRDTQTQNGIVKQVCCTEPFRSNGRSNARTAKDGRTYCRLSH